MVTALVIVGALIVMGTARREAHLWAGSALLVYAAVRLAL